jgi:hypothetical protein
MVKIMNGEARKLEAADGEHQDNKKCEHQDN